MVSKKELIGSILIATVLEARVDSLWKAIRDKQKGSLLEKNMEGATGFYDNKGGLFIPGGFVYEDSEGDTPSIDDYFHHKTTDEFRGLVFSAMKKDNATLIFHDGISKGVNLDNGFYIKGAKAIINYKKGSNKRKKRLELEENHRISSRSITRSYSPPYMHEYGSRTMLSACIGYFLQNPWGAYERFIDHFKLGGAEQETLFENVSSSQLPVKSRDGKVLAYPNIVVCHDSRIREKNMVGMTKIIPPGKPGSFSTITVEPAYKDLLAEMGNRKPVFSQSDYVASYKNDNYVMVMRSYTSPRNFGKRSPHKSTTLISPEKELGINLEKINEEARQRYGIN
ncbi:MAG: hypothetical protein ACOCQG_02815 [Candidatus Nanoarchaeia archaeon]